MSCELIWEQGAAYALGALEASEREGLEAHIDRCPACAREIHELQQATAQLALAVPQHGPPPELGERIFAVARAERDARARQAREVPPAASDRRPVSLRARVEPDAPESDRRAPDRKVSRAGRPPWLALGTLAAALAALVWGVSLQVQLAATQRQLAETNAQLERIRGAYATVVDVLASPATQERDLQAREGAPGARGRIWVDRATGRGMMMARDLPPLPEGQAYQVWLTNTQGRVSGGFLRPYDEGVYYVVLQTPGPLTDYQMVGVTREPLGGSPGPTGPRIIGGEI